MYTKQSLASRYKWPLIFAILLLVSLPLQVLLALSFYRVAPGHAFVTPQTSTFTVTETGKYTLWISNQETVDGQLVKYPQDVPSAMAFKLVRDADQAEIPLQPSINKTVSINSTKRKGHLIAEIHQPGQYTITTTGSSESRVLYFARDFVMKMVATILCAACSSVVLFGAMVGTAIYAVVKPPKMVVVQDDYTQPERVS